MTFTDIIVAIRPPNNRLLPLFFRDTFWKMIVPTIGVWILVAILFGLSDRLRMNQNMLAVAVVVGVMLVFIYYRYYMPAEKVLTRRYHCEQCGYRWENNESGPKLMKRWIAAEAPYARRFARSSNPTNKRYAGSMMVSESVLAIDRGDVGATQALLDEAIALFRQAPHPAGLGMAHVNQGAAALYVGDYATCESISKLAVTQLRQAKEWRGLSVALLDLGLAQVYQGQVESPRSYFIESLTIKQKLNDRGGVAEVLGGLAEVARLEHQPDRAARLYGAAEPLLQADPGLVPIDRCPGWQRSIDNVRTELGTSAFEAAHAEGRALSLEQAIAYALDSSSGLIPVAVAALST